MRKGKDKEIETEEDAAEEEVEAEEEEEEEGGLPTIPEAYEDPEFVVMYTAIMKAASRAGIIIEDSFPSVRHRSHPSSPLSLPSHPLPLPPSPPSHSLPSPPSLSPSHRSQVEFMKTKAWDAGTVTYSEPKPYTVAQDVDGVIVHTDAENQGVAMYTYPPPLLTVAG